jgi:hypothetical protein
MQDKSTLRFHLTPVEWLPSRTQTTTIIGGEQQMLVGKMNPHTLLVECKLVQPLWTMEASQKS